MRDSIDKSKIDFSEKCYLFAKFVLWISVITQIYFVFQYMRKTFPYAYVWSEAFIKYTQGYCRRGLLGYMLYQLPTNGNVKYAAIITSLLIAIALLVWSWRVLTNNFNNTFSILLFFGPCYYGFIVQDPTIILRKDCIHLLLLMLIYYFSYLACVSRISKKIAFILAIVMMIFAVAASEHVIFFCVLPILFMVFLFDKKVLTNPYAWVMAIVMLILLLITMRYAGTVAQRTNMMSDWTIKLGVQMKGGGMSYIGAPTSKVVMNSLGYLAKPNVFGAYFTAWVLSLIPIFIFVARYDYSRVFNCLFTTFQRYVILALLPIFVVAQSLYVIDYGRIIAYQSIMIILFIAFTIKVYREKFGEFMIDDDILDAGSIKSILMAIICSVFLLGWHLFHCSGDRPIIAVGFSYAW